MINRLCEKLRRLGERITWPIERAFAATFGRLFMAAEGANRIEDLLLALVRLLTWPFRVLGRALGWALGRLAPQSVRTFMASAPRAMGRAQQRLGAGLLALAERLNLDVPLRWLAWLLQPLWRPIAAVLGFLYAWLATRPYRQMLWGLPALVLLLPICATAAWGVMWGRGRVMTSYRLAFKEAQETGDYERMQLFERKLQQLGDRTEQTAFNAAAALAEDGKMSEAYQRMVALAPADQPGYAPAHFWIIQQALGGKLELPAEERRRVVGAHLDQLQAARIQSDQLTWIRAIWLAEGQQLEEAAALLKTIMHRLPAAAITRMAIHIDLKRLDEARVDAAAVCTHLEERQGRGEPIAADEYQSWALAEALLEDAADHAAVVAAWEKAHPDDPHMKQVKAELVQREFDQLAAAASPDAARLARAISEVAKLGGDPAELSRRVAALWRRQAESPAAAQVIEQLAADRETPAVVLQLLGTNALLAGDAPRAEALLKRSIERSPDDPVAWNNLACAIMEQPAGDLNEALAAVERALAAMPDAPQFRETRGQALVRLEQWQRAIDDLELAINSMPDSKAIHRSLAAAYAAVGQEELAEIHRQQGE